MLERLVITGSSGFLGRHLLEAVKDRYRIYGLARRSQLACGAPVHPNISWQQVDIADRGALAEAFTDIRRRGGADIVIHLAAHYDFTGEEHAEYQRTNVVGLRNVLEECRRLRLRRFVFSSSVAASDFPLPGEALTEKSPADGDHIYARTKRIGENMLAEYRDAFPSTIIRFSAMFSDWCEYPPLFMFLETWLSSAWNRNILGGQGRSAIPYLHVDEGVGFVTNLLGHIDDHDPGEVLIAGVDGCVSHTELFEESTSYARGEPARPVHMPRVLCGPGVRARLALGRLLGELPFERPWMTRYIDKQMTMDASGTRERLPWRAHSRLGVLRRLPFLLENRKSYPAEWYSRNHAAMKKVELRPNLTVYRLLEDHEPEINARFRAALTDPEAAARFPTYRRISLDDQQWNHRLVIQQMMQSIRTLDRTVFLDYCRDLAAYRYKQGFDVEEICRAIEVLREIVLEILEPAARNPELQSHLREQVNTAIAFGGDTIREVFEDLRAEEEAAAPLIRAGQTDRLPRVVVTGSSGFMGRHLLDLLKERCQIVGMARRSQARSHAPEHRNIRWYQVDVGDREKLAEVFSEIREWGPVDYVVHLAAHYDFAGGGQAEYRRTNIDGLRNVLEECKALRPKRFVFGSSLAACRFSHDGEPVTETTPLENDHIYAVTKREGERMLSEYREYFPSAIVRFAALFSDWCEYPPVYMFLQTWLSGSWKARILGGEGRSAIPYLHVRDAADLLQHVLEREPELEDGEVLIASSDGCVSHRTLFDESTRYYHDEPERPILMPKILCRFGIRLTNLMGRLRGELPFERPWMVQYIDLRLPVDASWTRERLGWSPRPRLAILDRLPLMIENLKAHPVEWNLRNRAAMKTVHMRPNLRVHRLLERRIPEIGEEFTDALVGSRSAGRFSSYKSMDDEELRWHVRLVVRNLSLTVRTRERGVFLSYCRDLAERRFNSGFGVDEVCDALEELNRVCIEQLGPECEEQGLEPYLDTLISMTIRFGCDQIQGRFEALEQSRVKGGIRLA